jgi:hypothetical protein
VILRESDSANSVKVDGVELGPIMLSDILNKSLRTAEKQVARLLLGFIPSDAELLSTNSALSHSAHRAFGIDSDSADGSRCLLNNLDSRPKSLKEFFKFNRDGSIVLKKRRAATYLNDCQKLEHSLVVALHIGTACTVRRDKQQRMSLLKRKQRRSV